VGNEQKEGLDMIKEYNDIMSYKDFIARNNNENDLKQDVVQYLEWIHKNHGKLTQVMFNSEGRIAKTTLLKLFKCSTWNELLLKINIPINNSSPNLSKEELIKEIESTKTVVSFGEFTDCWIYGHKLKNGYRSKSWNRKHWKIHVLASHLYKNEIQEEGYDFDHICENIECGNPNHIQKLSKKEHRNLTDSRNNRKKPIFKVTNLGFREPLPSDYEKVIAWLKHNSEICVVNNIERWFWKGNVNADRPFYSCKYVARMVLGLKNGLIYSKIPQEYLACHKYEDIDNYSLDVNPDNLYFGTRQQNANDILFRSMRPSKSYKIHSEDLIMECRKAFLSWSGTKMDFARQWKDKLGVSEKYIADGILNYRVYKDLKPQND
jgi:hypothetical protein